MKKVMLVLIGVLLLSGCTNKEMVTFYENTKAGEKIDSYQLDLRIYGNYDDETYSEIVRIDNYKGTQYKIDYISKNDIKVQEETIDEEPIEEENTEETSIPKPDVIDPMLEGLLEDNASYVIDGKNYSKVEGKYTEVDTLLYTNPNVYLETATKGYSVEFLFDETIGAESYKVYTFKVKKDDMKSILEDGVLKDLKLKEDVTAKLWADKDSKIFKVAYYLIDGKDKVEINASVFRINIINDMSNMVR